MSFYSENVQSTDVSGIIYDGSGGPWTVFGNPYIVVGDVTVPGGETLTIEPGVVVKFDGGYRINIYGNLTAVGTEFKNIIITSNMAMPAPRDWTEIRVISPGLAEIKYCDVSYSAFGIHLYPSSNSSITNNTISNSGNGIIVRESSNITIANNTISNNDIGIQLRDSSNITIINNNFLDDDIFISGDQLYHFNSHNITTDNLVNGKPLYYYKDTSGINIDNIPVGELILANCTDFNVNNIQINNTDLGIEVAYSTNISISNNNILSTYLGGIFLYSSSNNMIKNNDVTPNGNDGIFLDPYSNNNIIINNNVSSAIFRGIHVIAANNTITNNKVWNCEYGIDIWSSSNNTITGNGVSNNNYGILIVLSSNITITRNTISTNNWSIYIFDSSNNKITDNNISDNEYGLSFKSSNSNLITGNTISNNGNGIDLRDSSDDNVITSNIIFSNNNNGIHIKWASNNNITGNNISDNYKGINISQSSNDNLVRGNTVSKNDYGVYIGWAFNNIVYHNNLINNTVQAYDETVNGNQWDNGYPDGGNYWSDFDEPGEGAYDDYQGPNQDILGSDGIVDNGTIGGGGTNPYLIDLDSQDNYPLIELFKNYMILKEGWNLISIPLIQQEQNIFKVLNSIDGLYDAVQWYDITDTNDPWKHHKVGKPYGNDLFEINETMGFWIHIIPPGDTIFFYNGTRPTVNQTISLHTGWNLVGYPSRENKNRTMGLNNLDFGVEVDAIWAFDGATQAWEDVGPADDFQLGKGYWMHATQECVWEVPL